MEFAAEVGSGSLRPQSSRLSLDHCLKKGVLTISYKEGLKIIPYYDTFTFVCCNVSFQRVQLLHYVFKVLPIT